MGLTRVLQYDVGIWVFCSVKRIVGFVENKAESNPICFANISA